MALIVSLRIAGLLNLSLPWHKSRVRAVLRHSACRNDITPVFPAAQAAMGSIDHDTSAEPMPAASVMSADGPSTLSGELKSLLERAYGVQFTILDGQSGEVLYAAPGQPSRDWGMRAEMCREVARRGSPSSSTTKTRC